MRMDKLRELLERTSSTKMTPSEREAQRQSFAYGNTNFENEHITRDTVARASLELEKTSK
jgi:hypothetical protein